MKKETEQSSRSFLSLSFGKEGEGEKKTEKTTREEDRRKHDNTTQQ